MAERSELMKMYKEAFQSFARGELDAAIEGYRKVIELDGRFALAYQGLSEAHARKGDLRSAIEAIGKAIEVEPSESLYHTSLSRFLQRQGKIAEAEEAAANAASIQRGRPF